MGAGHVPYTGRHSRALLGGELFKQDLLAGLFITGKSDDKMWVFHPVTPEM
jgi:hypothetical protein